MCAPNMTLITALLVFMYRLIIHIAKIAAWGVNVSSIQYVHKKSQYAQPGRFKFLVFYVLSMDHQ